MIKGLTPYQIFGKLTSQTQKEGYDVCWKEGSQMTGQQLFQEIHTNFQPEEPICIRALQGHPGENLDFSTLHTKRLRKGTWILKTWRFNEIWWTCDRRIWNKQRQKNSVLLTRVAIGSEPRPKAQAVLPHEEPSWPIFCDWSGSSAEFAEILPEGERECRVLRVSCATTLPSEFLTKIINLKDRSEDFRKEEYREEEPSLKKKGRYDFGQPRETSRHNIKQETIEL